MQQRVIDAPAPPPAPARLPVFRSDLATSPALPTPVPFAVVDLPVRCLQRWIARRRQTSDAEATTTGTVRGTVVYVSDPSRPWRLGRYYIRNPRNGLIAEAVAALQARGLKGPADDRPVKTVTVDQKHFQFVPETSAIQSGDRVRFLNSDDHAHNVRSANPKHAFNVTMPVAGEHIETFKVATGTRNPYLIDCIFHSAMKAWIFVFNHPWFAVTGEEGSFEFKSVPPGEYRLEVVHPAGDLRHSESIRVVAGEVTEIPIRLQPSKQR